MQRPKRVLAIDGGGIRGIIPALVLQEIETRTQKPVAELFDFIAGTSTGGIIALALAKPDSERRSEYSAAELVELYEREGKTIFSRGPWHTVTALSNILEEKYPARGVEEVLQRYFGDARMSDCLTDVLVTSYEIERRIPYFFKSHRAKEDPSRDFPMWQAARATSAAPTYFEPAKVGRVGSEDYLALIDGGVYANNPALCAYAEAHDLYGMDTDFLVVSLGTGEQTREIPLEDAKGWGLALWAQPLLGVVFDGVSDTVGYQLKVLCNRDPNLQRYFRFQARLNRGSDDMDDARAGNLRDLRLDAEELMRDQEDLLENLCRQLTM